MTVDIAALSQQRPDVIKGWLNDVGSAGGQSLQDYANTWYTANGKNEGYNGVASPPAAPAAAPSPYVESTGNTFNPDYYLSQNPDVKGAVNAGQTTALQHYQTYGQKEGRTGNAADLNAQQANASGFNETSYDSANPDVASAIKSGQIQNGLDHYLMFGAKEGRSPNGNPNFNKAGSPAASQSNPITTTTGATVSTLSPTEQENSDETAAAVARGKARNQMFSSFLTGGNGGQGGQNTSPFGGAYMTNGTTRRSRMLQPSAFGGGMYGNNSGQMLW